MKRTRASNQPSLEDGIAVRKGKAGLVGGELRLAFPRLPIQKDSKRVLKLPAESGKAARLILANTVSRGETTRRQGVAVVCFGHIDRTAQCNLCNLLRSDTPMHFRWITGKSSARNNKSKKPGQEQVLVGPFFRVFALAVRAVAKSEIALSFLPVPASVLPASVLVAVCAVRRWP